MISRHRFFVVLAAIGGGLAVAWATSESPLFVEYIGRLLEQIDQLGPWAPVAMIALYAMATPLMIPTFPFMLANGFMFGLGAGLLYTLAGNTLGGLIAFRLARSQLRPRILPFIEKTGQLQALDHAIHNNGLSAACMIRMSPILPGPVINYGLGLTQLRTGDYLLATFATIPVLFCYTLIGDSLGALRDVFSTGPTDQLWLSAGLLALGIGLAALLTVRLKQAVHLELQETEDPRPSAPEKA